MVRYGFRIGSFVLREESTQSLTFAKHYVHRGNRLHHLWGEGGHCYSVSEECVCKLCCGEIPFVECGQLQVNTDNIRQIVKVLHT